MTHVLSAAEFLRAQAKRRDVKKRKAQPALDPSACYAGPLVLYLAGVTHPPINEWKAWHWTYYGAEKEKWATWVIHYARPMTRWTSGSKLVVRVVSFFPDQREHDPDGYAPKFILDGLTAAGVLPGDSGRTVAELRLRCVVADARGTLVTISPDLGPEAPPDRPS